MRSPNFATPTDAEIRELDRLAGRLRSDKRARQMAEGLPIQEAFAHYFAEAAGRAGSR